MFTKLLRSVQGSIRVMYYVIPRPKLYYTILNKFINILKTKKLQVKV